MIQKSLLYILTMGFIAIVLTACGGKGIDRKLDYSGTEEELGESFGKAMADATPEQQNILREHQMIVLSVVSLARNSNPATVDAFVAKKNAEEFQRLSKMSVRELFVEKLGKEQGELNSAINMANKYQHEKPVQVEKINIGSMDCTLRGPNNTCNTIRVEGELFLRNTADTKVTLDECRMALVLDGKPIDEGFSVSDCSGKLESKGAAKAIKFGQGLGYGSKPGTETITHIYELYKTGNAASIAWAVTPSFSLESNKGQRVELDDKSMDDNKAVLAKITADLAVLKK